MTALTAEEIKREALAAGIECTVLDSVRSRMDGNYHSVLLMLESARGISCFCASWEGSVKWIWQSAYRPGHKRKNWFVKVSCFKPDEKAQLSMKDIKFESMRASGPGGQHINKTESAVRAVHIPTGRCAVAQDERSQYMNKKLALARLELLFDAESRKAESLNRAAMRQEHYTVARGDACTVRVYDAATLKRIK